MTKLGLGVIGCGNMGASLANGARDLDCAEVVCVSDVDREKGHALSAKMGCDYEADYHTMLAREDVRAVMIATPPFLHIDPTIAAARAGVHVFCEKPMSPTLAGCDAMIAACEQGGRRVGYWAGVSLSPGASQGARFGSHGRFGNAFVFDGASPGRWLGRCVVRNMARVES